MVKIAKITASDYEPKNHYSV